MRKISDIINFYPRPPRGGRPFPHRWQDRNWQISIHALREEGDLGQQETIELTREFLSTPSARRATFNLLVSHTEHLISIHALREEGDWDPDREDVVIKISIHALREEGDKYATM